MVQRRYGKRGKAVKNMEEEEIDELDDEENIRSYSVAYCEGWYVILKRSSGYECFLWNPTSRNKIRLPCLKSHLSFFSKRRRSLLFNKCVLSSPPTNARCTVLFFTYNEPSVLYCKVGNNRGGRHVQQWVKEFYSSDGEKYDHAIAFNRKVYAINLDGEIFEIVLGGRKKLKHEPCEIEKPFLFPWTFVFVESCEELFLVMMFSKLKIEVFRVDFSLKKLVKIDSLGDRIFFLCNSYSSSISGEEIGGIKGNRIYFSKDNYKSLYVLDFEHASLSVTPNRSDSTTLWFSHNGFMPALRISDDPTNKEQEIAEESIEGDEESVFNTEESIWLKLPNHLLQLISQCLSQGRDYMNFRGVCRNWRSLAPPCRWHSVSTDCSTTIPYPWLMFIGHEEDGICNFYDPRDNVTYSMNDPILSKNCVIRFSKDGWLFVSQGPRSVFLYEPFANRKIELPDLPKDYCFIGVCFSTPPTTSSSSSTTTTIVGVSHIGSEWIHICYHDVGKRAWNEVDFNNIGISFDPSWNNPVFLHGSFYFLGDDGRLAVFDVNEEEIGPTWKIRSKPIQSHRLMWDQFIMSFEEELISVFVGKVAGELVKVFRLDLLGGDNWVELKSLDNGILLFISKTTSLAVTTAAAKEEKMKNKIYTPNFSTSTDNHNVFYCLETQRYHTFGGRYNSSQGCYGTREQLHGTWIQPRLLPSFCDDK